MHTLHLSAWFKNPPYAMHFPLHPSAVNNPRRGFPLPFAGGWGTMRRPWQWLRATAFERRKRVIAVPFPPFVTQGGESCDEL